MKASEICIGDWFKAIDYNSPFRITAIYDDVVQTQADYQSEIDGNWYSEAEIKDLVPIELTEEILVKNGFRYTANVIGRHNCKCYELEQKGVYHMTISIYKNEITCELDKVDAMYMNVVTNYVHTMQHLLRLCGIEKEIEL